MAALFARSQRRRGALGLEFTRADDETALPVAIIVQTTATRFFRSADPVGRRTTSERQMAANCRRRLECQISQPVRDSASILVRAAATEFFSDRGRCPYDRRRDPRR